MLMKTILDEFKNYLTDELKMPTNSVIAYTTDTKYFLKFIFEMTDSEDIYKINDDGIQNYFKDLEEQHYRSSSIVRKYATLKVFLRFLKERNYIDYIFNIESPKVSDKPSITVDKNDTNKMMRLIDDSLLGIRDKTLLMVASQTGLKITEIVALNDYDIIYKQRKISFKRTTSKRIDSNYEINISEELYQQLFNYMHVSRNILARYYPHEHALFVNHHGQRLTRQGTWLIIKRYAKMIGRAEITLQSLRRFALV